MGEGKRRQLRYEELESILASGKNSEIRKVVDEVTKHLTDQGRLIEAGWMSLRAMAVPDDALPVQIDEMRTAFFAGAQHLFGSIMTFLDEGQEPTERDLHRMDSVHQELQGFIEKFKMKHTATEGQA